MGISSLHAQFVWNPISGNNLSNPLNWVGSLLPSANSTINFGPASLASSVNLDVSYTAGTVNFSGPTAFGVSTSNGSVLTINTAVTNASTASSAVAILAPVVLGGNVTVNNSSTTANLNVQNTVTGSGSLTLTAATGRTLLLANGGAYTGGTTLSSGTLTVGDGFHAGATLVGNVTGSTGAALAFNLLASDTVAYSGNLSGGIGVSVSGSGAIMTFSGSNTHTGGTLVAAGASLVDGQAGAFSSGSVLSLGAGSTLGVNFNETLGGLASNGGAGTINVGNGKTLTVSNSLTQGPFSGIITGTGASFVKNGAGNMQMSGASTYTGGTTINGGVIFATNASGSALGSGPISIGSGAALQLGAAGGGATGSVAGAVTFTGSTASLNFDLTGNTSFSNGVSGPGFINQLGSAILTLGGVNTYTGGTVVSAGTLADGQDGAFSSSSVAVVRTGANLAVNFNESVLGLQGNMGQGGTVTIAGGKTLTLNPGATRFFPGLITGAGSLTIGGLGLQILAGVNTYTGGTTINSDATLQLGNTDSNLPSTMFPVIAAGSVTGAIVNDGTLILDQPDNGTAITFGNAISGSGSVFINGDAVLILPNANTYSGGTIISNGTVQLTNTSGSALGSGVVTVVGAGGSTGILAGNTSIPGMLSLGPDGVIFPGTYNHANHTLFPGVFSPGNTVFVGGGGFIFGINDATGVEGTNWSLLNIAGVLAISADNTTPFLISVNSIDASDMSGQVINFDSSQSYSWRIVTTPAASPASLRERSARSPAPLPTARRVSSTAWAAAASFSSRNRATTSI